MKKTILFSLCAAMILLCGCRTQIVTLDVVPADAKVIANGVAYENHSPMFIEASTGKELVITAYKEGYRDKIYVIDYQLSTYGKIEAWTSFLIIPMFGLMANNAWELKETNIAMRLEPITEAAKRESLNAPARILPIDRSVSSADQTDDKKARELFNEL